MDIVVNTVSFGSGSMVREMHLLQHLARIDDIHTYHVLCEPAVRETLGALGENFVFHEVDKLRNSVMQPNGTFQRILWENIDLLRWIRRVDGDLLYFPQHITNLVDTVPKIVAIRNVAPFYLEAHRNRTLRESLRLRALRLATRRSVSQAERVIFFTEATRDAVAEYVPAVTEKSTVIPHGVPDGFEPVDPDPDVVAAYGLPSRFLLSVSNVARYKNQVELVEGYARAIDGLDDPPALALAGKVVDREYDESLRERVEELGVGDLVVRMCYVDHDDLPALHAASSGFVFSSACENAPMTLIEALACGSPIACSDAASMPEICGEAALYFDPYDPADIATALRTLITSPERRSDLSSAALERASAFSWSWAAEQTLAVFEDVR